MLDISNVSKRYGDLHALRDLSFKIIPGEIAGLVGHNGAGKTTLVEILTGLTTPDDGTVLIDGLPPREARGLIGVAPQSIALYPSATVREHLQLFGRVAGLGRRELGVAIDELAETLGLEHFLDRSAGVLSGGQQRRTQAATALIHRPRLLVLDEPTAGADLETRTAMIELVRARAREGAAVLYTTHYLPELTDLEATIAVIKAGQIVARGTYEHLVHGLPGEVVLTYDDGAVERESTLDPTGTLVRRLGSADRVVTNIEVRNPTLDDLYRARATREH